MNLIANLQLIVLYKNKKKCTFWDEKNKKE